MFLSPRLKGLGSSAIGSYGANSASQMLVSGGAASSFDKDSIIAALYSRSPLLASSPSRDFQHVSGLTDSFCKDFVCCGIKMDNLHDLLQHFEEYHAASSVSDIDEDSDSDIDNIPLDFHLQPDDHPLNDSTVARGSSLHHSNQLWNSFGRSRTLSMGVSERMSMSPNFGPLDEPRSKYTKSDENNVHLPFAFESFSGNEHSSESTSSKNPNSNPLILSENERNSLFGTRSGVTSAVFNFSARSIKSGFLQTPSPPPSSSAHMHSMNGRAEDNTFLFNENLNLLSTSLGAMSVSGGHDGRGSLLLHGENSGMGNQDMFRQANIRAPALSPSTDSSGASASRVALSVTESVSSPSTSLHTATPPPLHSEAFPSGRRGIISAPVTSSSLLAGLSHSEYVDSEDNVATDDSVVIADGSTPDTRRRGSNGQLLLKRKVDDDRMDVDEINLFLESQLDPTRIGILNGNFGSEDLATSKRLLAEQIAEFITEEAGGVTASPPLQPTTSTHAALSQFRKRNLLASASFSPKSGSSPPPVSLNAQLSLLPGQLKFNEMSAQEIDAFQKMTPHQQHDHILSSLDSEQLALLMLMVSQTSSTSEREHNATRSSMSSADVATAPTSAFNTSPAKKIPKARAPKAPGTHRNKKQHQEQPPPPPPPPSQQQQQQELQTSAGSTEASSSHDDTVASGAMVNSALPVSGARGAAQATTKPTKPKAPPRAKTSGNAAGVASASSSSAKLKEKSTAEKTAPTAIPATATARMPAAKLPPAAAAAAAANSTVSPVAGGTETPPIQPAASTADNPQSDHENSAAAGADDRPFKCHLCDKAYKNPGGIKYHLKHTHGIDHVSFADVSEASRPYICTVEGCGKRYKNLNGLKYHIEHVHMELLEGVSSGTSALPESAPTADPALASEAKI
ncbi:hypothetical protein HDU83_000628 [Entophlyctis luteolus]|nr:hypothetical protein HDU83_000628 [Entophlyctis luteolus]